jgi:hypothetical protein
MIYFIQNKVTGHIKIGYSKNPKKRLASLQTATPHELALLGTIPGGLEHEGEFHRRFAGHELQGEWFDGAILPEVQQILAKAVSTPQPQYTNVIVAGDSDSYFMWSSDQQEMERRNRLEADIGQALDRIHAATPIAWVITGGERLLDHFAAAWANKNKVEHYPYRPNWRRYGKGAASRAGQQMLRSMFDPKLLLVFYTGEPSVTTKRLMRGAEKAGIPVVLGAQPQQVP